MSIKLANFSSQFGGWSTDLRLGPPNSFAYSQALDFRKSPSQMSVLPGLIREDGGVVKDLVLKEVMTSTGTIYAYGNAGYFYKRTTAGVWSAEGKLTTGTGGLDYRKDSDAIYLTTSKAVSLYNQVSTNPTLLPDFYGPSYSTYNNSDNMGFNVSAYQEDRTTTTTIGTTILEDQTTSRFFQSDIEPLVKISVFITNKGIGDWTLTLHDGLNNVLGVKTVTNANLVNNKFNDFIFTAAPNEQVRIYPAPNARTYHIHVTSTVADGVVSSSTKNNLSNADLQVWADRLIVTKNGLHPMIRYQQYEAIGNSNYVSIWEPISTPPTNAEWQRHRLVFPEEYEVCGLAVQNEFLVIAAEKNTTLNTSTPQEGILFFWDGTSPTYNYFVEVPEGSPLSLKTYKNIAYYVAGGFWYAITSVASQPVKIRTLPGSDNEFSGITTSAAPIAGTETLTTSGVWTVPDGVTRIRVKAWGAGGGGSGRSISGGGGGGGGGAYASSIINVTPGDSYAITIGTGGGSSAGGSGTSGSATSFASLVVAAGGAGQGGAAGTGPGGAGGTTAASTGDIKFAGGAGGGSSAVATYGGGGGESGGPQGTGNNGSSSTGAGGSGNSNSGDGGDGFGPSTNGTGGSGTVPGGAGGGAYRVSGNQTGGSGARGEVQIVYGGDPLTETLVDNFSGVGSIPDTSLWDTFGNVSQANGVLSLTTNLAAGSHGISSHQTTYDLTGSSMQVRLVDAGNQALTSLEVFPVLAQLNTNNQLYWYVNQNTIRAYKKIAGVNTSLASAVYTSSFEYLRIRETNGVIYWDYSLDGVTWSNFTSLATPFAITSLTQEVQIGNFNAEASATTCLFDDYNVIVRSDYVVGYPEMMSVRRGVFLLGYPAITTNPNTNYGVYSWGAIDKNYPNSFGYSYLLSTGSQNFSPTNNLQIGMVKTFGDLLHVSWRDDLNDGTARYGVDVVNNTSSPAPIAIWESPIITSGYTAKYKSGVFIESYYSLPVGASITLAYSIDQGEWITSPAYTSTTLWQEQAGYARFNVTDSNGGRFHELQARITITCEATVTTPPIIQEVNIAYNANQEEQIQ